MKKDERKWHKHLAQCGVTQAQLLSAIDDIILPRDLRNHSSSGSKRKPSSQQPDVMRLNSQNPEVSATTVTLAKRACISAHNASVGVAQTLDPSTRVSHLTIFSKDTACS